MEAQELVDRLKEGSLTTEELHNLGLSKPLCHSLLDHKKQWIDYISTRLNHRFTTNSEISRHTAQFCEEMSMHLEQVKVIHKLFKVSTLRLAAVTERQKLANERAERRLEEAKHASLVIEGLATGKQIEEAHGIGERKIYRVTDKLLALVGVDSIRDLKNLSAPKRKALAVKALQIYESQLDSYLEKQINNNKERYTRGVTTT